MKESTICRILASLLAILVMTGCSTAPQALDPKAAAGFQDQVVARTVHPRPGFYANTSATVLAGLVGLAAAKSEGTTVVEANNVEDPAVAIASALSDTLVTRHGARSLAGPIPAKSGDAATIAASSRGLARFIVDVKTLHWSSHYLQEDASRYRIFYMARARLIDASSGAVVAQAFCKHRPDSAEGAPNYGQLMGNQASGLKRELRTATEDCIAEFRSMLFGVTSVTAVGDDPERPARAT